MFRATRLMAFAAMAALLLSACDRDNNADSADTPRAEATDGETGGSRKGDFGPPQGQPV